jgi:hypothetical protein
MGLLFDVHFKHGASLTELWAMLDANGQEELKMRALFTTDASDIGRYATEARPCQDLSTLSLSSPSGICRSSVFLPSTNHACPRLSTSSVVVTITINALGEYEHCLPTESSKNLPRLRSIPS